MYVQEVLSELSGIISSTTMVEALALLPSPASTCYPWSAVLIFSSIFSAAVLNLKETPTMTIFSARFSLQTPKLQDSERRGYSVM